MHYVVPDIHNDYVKFEKMLRKIRFDKHSDWLILLGDLFDRADYGANPMDLYRKIQSLEECCTIVRGNHDEWLAQFIYDYLDAPEEMRGGFAYDYNTFSILRNKLTDRDLNDLADWLHDLPLQKELTLDGEKYLFAHAMTSLPEDIPNNVVDYYLMGNELEFFYLKNGLDGYISVCGHSNSDTIRRWMGEDYKPEIPEVWVNKKGNVYMMDCGCGMYERCKLSCMCLETKEICYV